MDVAVFLTILNGCNPASVPEPEKCEGIGPPVMAHADSSRNTSVSTWRFLVTDDGLYALGEGTSYGTEGPIYTTNDNGQTWSPFYAPVATRELAGNGNLLYALTSKSELWSRRAADKEWSLIRRDSPYAFLYGVILGRKGTTCITGAGEIIFLDQQGKMLEHFQAPSRSVFARSSFATPDEQQIIVEASPFTVFVFDIAHRKLMPWTEGLNPNLPDNLFGACKVAQHGNKYLLNYYDGIYVADGFSKPWRRLSKRVTQEDLFRGNFCRTLCSFDASTDRWLMADEAGIYLMQGQNQERRVWSQQGDECALIADIVPYAGRYYVSFIRLKPNVLGIALSGDLSDIEVLRFPEK
jgi:hypothetical protein